MNLGSVGKAHIETTATGADLLVIGGANGERGANGSWVTKPPVADYMHELANHFTKCTWFSTENRGSPLTQTPSDTNRIRLFAVER